MKLLACMSGAMLLPSLVVAVSAQERPVPKSLTQRLSAAAISAPMTPHTPGTATIPDRFPLFPNDSQWIAAGFVGSEFGSGVADPSVDFGGHLDYLWNGALGGELFADLAPNAKLGNALFANNLGMSQ